MTGLKKVRPWIFIGAFCVSFSAHSSFDERELELASSSDYFQSSDSCALNGYDPSLCNNSYPGTSPYEWRYIEGLGYRKFSPLGAERKDWLQYKKYLRNYWHRQFYY